MAVSLAKENYYYFISGLPDLTFDDVKLPADPVEFKQQLLSMLSDEDSSIIRRHLFRFDNIHLLKLLENKEYTFQQDLGSFSEDEIRGFISSIKENPELKSSIMPDFYKTFILAFLDEKPLDDNLSWEDQLSDLYYQYLLEHSDGFFAEFYAFELNVKNILTAYISRNNNLQADKKIVGSGEIAQALRSSTAKDFGIGNTLPYLPEIEKIILINDIKDQERKIDQLYWSYLDEHTFFYYFSVEKLFAWFAKLLIIQRWAKLDAEEGAKTFGDLMGKLENSYQFPDEFSINTR